MHPIPPPFPTIKYKPGAESGSSVAFSLGDAQPNPLPCPSVSGTMSLDPQGSPTVGRDPTSVRRLSSEGCDLRRPINTAKAKAAWVMVPMGSSSWYVKSAGSPLALPYTHQPQGPKFLTPQPARSTSAHCQVAKPQNQYPYCSFEMGCAPFHCPSLWQVLGHVPPCTTRPMLQRSKGHGPLPGHWGNYEGSLQAL